jgi:RNA polymerase sigma factor (TIGR02999 family)
MQDVTQILSQIESGDPSAADKLLPLVYAELRRLAKARMANERSDHTLQSTALVHEAYVRLVDVDKVQHWDSRGHFFSAAAEAMRRILVESARRKQSTKRGGEYKRIEINDDLAQSLGDSADELIDFNSALDQLANEDPQAAELVKLRLFAGLSVAEASRVLGMPSSTAYESWEFARAWFTCRLSSDC